MLMKTHTRFDSFFQGRAFEFLRRLIDLSLEEDGTDLTSNAAFPEHSSARAVVTAKEDCVVAGLPIAACILDRIPGQCSLSLLAGEGEHAAPGSRLMSISGQTRKILKAERIILNFLARLSGIATLTRSFCSKLEGTGVTLLDTRKTTPGHRYPEKYAVLVGGAMNHRLNLEQMLMLKDNHIDGLGSITAAVRALRAAYVPCPPIEVECRNTDHVREAVSAGVDWIMLDNMSIPEIEKALQIIPQKISSEVSGGITLDNIEGFAALKPDYISTGAITHSAPGIDLSMRIEV
ncbi:MAG: carboxylating nicotinate-nucleotide diphosphorylase [Desulfonatronovibrionaceae bacterium]